MFRFHVAIDQKPPSPQLFLPMDCYEAEQILYDLGLDGPGAEHDIVMYSDNSGIHIDPGKDLRALNRLAQRIEDMSESERADFQAWGSTQGVCSVETALKASCHVDSMAFFPGLGNDEALGAYALDSGFFDDYSTLPEDIYAALDKTKAGAHMREMDGGVFTNGGYLIAGDITGAELPAEEPLAFFQGRFSDRQRDSGWCDIPLSAEDDSRIAAMLEQDPGLEMECRSIIPQLNGIISGTDELPELKLLSEALNGMGGEKIQKYKALLEVAQPGTSSTALHLADDMGYYDVTLEYADPANYGLQHAAYQYSLEADCRLLDYVDLAGYGAEMLKAEGYESTRYGAVYRNAMAMKLLSGPDTVYSGDCYCGRTEGFPTNVCWDPDAQKVWLELDDYAADSEMAKDFAYYQGLCEDWGVRHCASQEDYEQIIRDLGAQPYDEFMAAEQGDQSFGGMGGLS